MPRRATAAASRLSTNVNIHARVAELKAAVAEKVGVTVQARLDRKPQDIFDLVGVPQKRVPENVGTLTSRMA